MKINTIKLEEKEALTWRCTRLILSIFNPDLTKVTEKNGQYQMSKTKELR